MRSITETDSLWKRLPYLRTLVTANIQDTHLDRYGITSSADPDPREKEHAIWSVATLVLRASELYQTTGLKPPNFAEQDREFKDLGNALEWAIDFHTASKEELQKMIEDLRQFRTQLHTTGSNLG